MAGTLLLYKAGYKSLTMTKAPLHLLVTEEPLPDIAGGLDFVS